MIKNEAPAATLLYNISLPGDVTLNERDLCDLEMLLTGAFAPLNGYLNYDDFCSVVRNARLVDGTIWPIPIVLPIKKSFIEQSENPEQTACTTIKLRNLVGTVLAEVHVTNAYEPHVYVVAKSILNTTDDNHPYVQYLREEDAVYVGGHVKSIHPIQHFDFRDLRQTPNDIKKLIKEKNWDVVVGFQTRNPLHRSHFELTKQALKEAASDGSHPHLLLTPACGPTQTGDIKYHVRVQCYKKIINYYSGAATLVLLPLAMRMAGPREALWHALIRKNYGCTHFIVGRDHAGPSSKKVDGTCFYEPYEAHQYLKAFKESEIGIKIIYGKNILYLGEKLGYVPEDKKPSGTEAYTISGTKFRKMLELRETIPEWYSFEPIIKVLQSHYKKRNEQGFCLYFTGLPCSGKSTLANAMEAALLERESENRQITILDADVIRTHLSHGLGYNKKDRQINVQRIGYVASLVVQNSGICIVANIAPYHEDRMINRRLINGIDNNNNYIEVYVSTPLEICEGRDIKQLYKKARTGEIKQFTGISDPYEIPKNPELIIDSSEDIIGKVQIVLNYLIENEWIL